MDKEQGYSKRDVIAGMLGVAAGAAAVAGATSSAQAQLIDTGIDPKSVLAKIKKGGELHVGYAQLPLWFFKEPKTGELKGVYKELVDVLARDIEMTVVWHEVTFANSTIGLRSGDFDLFGSSLSYTIPRATVVNYVGPLWAKGSLALIRKADAEKYKTASDLNSPDVVISVNAGSADEQRMPAIFPKAKIIAVAGQYAMAAEPVRASRATACIVGDTEAFALARRNPEWAVVLDPSKSIDKRPNGWIIRYGDTPWKNFLDSWCSYISQNGELQRIYDRYATDIL
jgi:polar amino acid transport system substrate-binding protein